MNSLPDKRTIHKIFAGIFTIFTVFMILLLYNKMPNIAGYAIVGVLVGIVIERSRFCFVSAVTNLVLNRDGRIMRGVLVGLVIAIIGFACMMIAKVPDPSNGEIPLNAQVVPMGWHILIGGLLFGIGSTLSGGCVVGSFCRLGEGSFNVVLLTIGLLLGVSFYEIQQDFWYERFIQNAPNIWLPTYLGWPGAIVVSILILGLLYYGIRIFEAGSFDDFKKQYHPLNSLHNFSLKRIVKPWPLVAGGIGIGVVSIFSYWFVQRPIGVSPEYNRWADIILNSIGINIPNVTITSPKDVTWCLILNCSIFMGALIVALFSGDFNIRFPKKAINIVRIILGATIMGYGVGLAGGCNVGAFFSGVASFGLNGWMFGLFVFIGSMLCIRILQKINN